LSHVVNGKRLVKQRRAPVDIRCAAYRSLHASPEDSTQPSEEEPHLLSLTLPLEHPVQKVRAVGHEPVHPVAEQAAHALLGIDSPYIHPKV
jgi:hypothetical protein